MNSKIHFGPFKIERIMKQTRQNQLRRYESTFDDSPGPGIGL